MKRKFEIEINGKIIELESQKELRWFKNKYNNYEFMTSERIDRITASMKQPNIIVDVPNSDEQAPAWFKPFADKLEMVIAVLRRNNLK